MKKLILGAFIVCFATLRLLALETETVNGVEWTYEIRDGGAALIGTWQCDSTCIPQTTVGDIMIPSALGGYPVTCIEEGAFDGCDRIVSVTIPSNVTNIEIFAFSGCTSLTSVTIRSDLRGKVSYSSPFAGCNSLVSVVYEEGVTQINRFYFERQSSLKSVSIPSSVTKIGEYAFRGCSGLTSVTIPEGVTSIGRYAFRDCSSMTEVTIPSSATSIGSEAFSGCSSLGDGVVIKNGCVLCVNGDCPAKPEIPPGTRMLADGVFSGCAELASVTIPSSMAIIGSHAFANCAGLTNVTFLGSAPMCDVDVFDGSLNVKIVAPMNSDGWVQWKGRPFSYNSGNGAAEHVTAALTVTNVVIHYVVNSVQPERATPVGGDTGFVNIVTEVKSCGAVSVPETWAQHFPDFQKCFGMNFAHALMKQTGKRDGAGNPMQVWQDYVAGTDPTNPEDKFTASITMVEDVPVISWSPELPAAQAQLRSYKIYGKVKLGDAEWTEVNGNAANFNFFKVTVEMK